MLVLYSLIVSHPHCIIDFRDLFFGGDIIVVALVVRLKKPSGGQSLLEEAWPKVPEVV